MMMMFYQAKKLIPVKLCIEIKCKYLQDYFRKYCKILKIVIFTKLGCNATTKIPLYLEIIRMLKWQIFPLVKLRLDQSFGN